jgi:hypothetical protein
MRTAASFDHNNAAALPGHEPPELLVSASSGTSHAPSIAALSVLVLPLIPHDQPDPQEVEIKEIAKVTVRRKGRAQGECAWLSKATDLQMSAFE